MRKRGLLLVNLGTPDSTEVRDVRRYLDEFLSDPRVIDVAPALRTLLVKGIILPTRPRKSAAAYRVIWTEDGSPLLVYGRELEREVAEQLGSEWKVVLAMRYQNPSIEKGFAELRREGVDDVVVFPLFPQYSSAAYGSAVARVYDVASTFWTTPFIQVVPPYYDAVPLSLIHI